MQEFLTRMQVLFQQLGERVSGAISAAEPDKAVVAALDAVLPVACAALRVAGIVFAVLILYRCVASLVREKTGRELWGWLTTEGGARFDLLHWENTLGRGRWADVALEVPTVSRSHAALLRDDRGNWRLQPLQTKNGTRLNGQDVAHTVPVHTGDIIDLGGLLLAFHAVSERTEREEAMRWGVAERPLSPARTLGYLTVFQIMMAVQCLPGRTGPEMGLIAVAFGILITAMWGLYGIYRSRRRTAFELESIAFLLCTVSFGITSAHSPTGLLRQGICLLMGLVVFFGLSVLLRDLRTTVALRWPVAILTCLLLIFNVVLGQRLFGAKNWIDLGFVSFQPSEIAKFGVICSFAAIMAAHTRDMKTIRYGVAPYVVILGIIAVLLYLEPHMSATLIILALGFILMTLGGTDWKYLVGLVILGCLLVAVYLLTKGYTGGRISAWLHPENDPLDKGLQVLQSQYAIGSGGLLGLGFGRGRQKYLYLPEEHNDYIFAIACEELGFVGAIGILILFALLIIRGYWIAMHARDRFSMLLAAGLTTLLALQVFLNVAVVTNLLPSTGISLPFFSYGGTALIMQLAENGIVLNVSRSITQSPR